MGLLREHFQGQAPSLEVRGTPYCLEIVFSKLGKQQEQFLAVTGENVLWKFKTKWDALGTSNKNRHCP